jgi:PPOX class probable F420-dependent enzyme
MAFPFYAREVSFDELPPWALGLIKGERVARLAFVDDLDHPRLLPVTYALAEDAVWSAIDDKPKRADEPARVRYLRRRPEAALCVDRYDDDWSRLAWVQLLGRVEVLPVERGAAGLEALTERYAPYRERRPPGPLLRLEVERALHWRST